VAIKLQEPSHMNIKSFRDLDVWRLSMELARKVYTATAAMPWPHRHEIGGQMRRAGVSTPSNIAEGFRQGSARAYVHHVRVACGSTAELETQAELATDMGLWLVNDGTEIRAMAERTGRMLTGLASALDESAGRTCPVCRNRRR
jgi:four helix bundle protein